MTLIATLVNKDRIVQASDRRLTLPSGEVYDEKANKALAIGMGYVHFVVSYTGLAYIGRIGEDNRTDRWLQEQLGAITRNGEPSLEDICNSLSQKATEAMSKLRVAPENKGLKIVMAGFDRNNRPFRGTVSNIRFKSHDVFDVRDRFVSEVRSYHAWSPMPDLDVAGTVGAFEAKDNHAKKLKKVKGSLHRHLKKHSDKLDDERLARKLVTLVRAASTHPVYGPRIGVDCLSVSAVPMNPSMDMLYSMSVAPSRSGERGTPFEGFYHPWRATTILYGPVLVDPYFDIQGIEVDLDPKPLEERDRE